MEQNRRQQLTVVAFRLESLSFVDDVRADAVMNGPFLSAEQSVLRVVGRRQEAAAAPGRRRGHEIRRAKVLLVHKEFVIMGAARQLNSSRLPVLGRQWSDNQITPDRAILMI